MNHQRDENKWPVYRRCVFCGLGSSAVLMLLLLFLALISEKNSFYESYHDAQAREQELRIVRDNIDAAIGRNQEQAHSRRGHRRDDLSL